MYRAVEKEDSNPESQPAERYRMRQRDAHEEEENYIVKERYLEGILCR